MSQRKTDHLHYQDQVGYSTEAVEAYLPAVWDPEFVLSARPAKAAPNGVRVKADPRHIPDWLLASADVQVGFARAGLNQQEKECLRHVYGLQYTAAEIAAIWNVRPELVQAACMSGIRKIARYLSGKAPR